MFKEKIYVNNKEYHTSRSSVFLMRYHVVMSTKYRKGVITDDMSKFLEAAFRKHQDRHQIKVIEFNHDKNHIHIIIDGTPESTIQKWISGAKATSSRYVKIEFPEITKTLHGSAFWTHSYFIESVGSVNLDTISEYVKNQGRLVDNKKERKKRKKKK